MAAMNVVARKRRVKERVLRTPGPLRREWRVGTSWQRNAGSRNESFARRASSAGNRDFRRLSRRGHSGPRPLQILEDSTCRTGADWVDSTFRPMANGEGKDHPKDRTILLAHPAYGWFWCARVAAGVAFQMQAVAVGWQIYELTHSTFQLG